MIVNQGIELRPRCLFFELDCYRKGFIADIDGENSRSTSW
jgi:hypothetical protein